MAITINLELTDLCNIKCKMCSQSMRDEAHGAPMQYMSWETWRQSLNNLESIEEELHLCPHWLGEPTLHPEFDRFIEYAFSSNHNNRRFRKFKLHTNAVIFNEDRATLLLELTKLSHLAPDTFSFIHFSLDAHSPEVYREVKGADHGMRVRRNIERFLELREQGGYNYPKLTIGFVVQPDNAADATAFQQHWLDVFSSHGLPLEQHLDWPSNNTDSIYFRPLNCSDQQASDLLHAEVAYELGLTDQKMMRLRGDGSF